MFKAQKPARNLKKTIDPEEARRKREETSVELRKQTRTEQLLVKRRMGAAGQIAQDGAGTVDVNKQRTEVAEKLKAIPALVQGVMSDDPTLQLDSVVQFRKMLSIERNPPIQEVIDSNIVPRLVQFLTIGAYPLLQFESAWALTNIASGTSQHTQVVVQHGAVQIFIQLLTSPNEEVREQAVWALGNIAGDSADCRNLVLEYGSMGPLLSLCAPNAKPSLLRNATWTLSNLCRGKPQPNFEKVRAALPVLANLINTSQDDEVLTDACWALSYLSDDTGPQNQKIQAVISSGVCRRLVELLMHNNANIKTPALRTVGNIVTGDDLQTQAIMNCSVLPCLASLLANPKKSIRKEACWTISNITAGNSEQIGSVINANLIPPMVNILNIDEFDIKKEAAWAISNATSGGKDEQIHYLVQQGVIPPLCALFDCQDPKIVTVALEGIENILRVGQNFASRSPDGHNQYANYVEECQGLASLEKLQKHENHEIYQKVLNILQSFFESDEEEEVDMAPEVAADAQQFSFGSGSGAAPGGFNF